MQTQKVMGPRFGRAHLLEHLYEGSTKFHIKYDCLHNFCIYEQRDTLSMHSRLRAGHEMTRHLRSGTHPNTHPIHLYLLSQIKCNEKENLNEVLK